jgi:hypothetical protein
MEDKIVGAFSSYGGKEKCKQSFGVGKHVKKKTVGTPTRECEDNIKKSLIELVWDGVDTICYGSDRKK